MIEQMLFDIDLQPRLIPDVCENRHKGNAESIAANPDEATKRAAHTRILDLLVDNNLTSKEIAAKLGTELHCVSGRLSELLARGDIMRVSNQRREGCSVLRRVW